MKKTKILTLAVASVMALGAVALASCGGKTGTSLLKDESIKSKIIAAYDFENEGAAVDAYTGEALGKFDLTFEDGFASVDGKDGKGIQSGSTIATLPQYGDAMSEESGFSFTYMSYGTEGYNDWGVLIESGFMNVTYGNLAGCPADCYPAAPNVVVGRGAYSATSYATAQNELSSRQLAKYNSYTGYNAGCVEAIDDAGVPGQISAEMINKWVVTTVVITDDSVSFYRDGALAYTYGADNVGDMADFMLLDLIDLDGGDDTPLNIFKGACGVVDNIVVGQALEAEEVLALYNDLAGASKTMADVNLESKVAGADALDAKDDATAAATAKRAAGIVALMNKELEGKTFIETIGNEELNAGWVTWGSKVYKPEVAADGTFEMTIKYYQLGTGTANWHSTSTFLFDGGVEVLALRQDAFGWAPEGGTGAYVADLGEDWSWTNFTMAAGAGYIEETLKYDGTNLTLTLALKPIDAGKTYSATATVGSATETVDLVVCDTISYTYTIGGVSASDISLKLGLECAYTNVIEVVGGTYADAE